MKNKLYKILFFWMVFAFTLPLQAQKIKTVEYWVDGNHSERVQAVTEQSASILWESSINMSGLADGLHTFHIRFCDDAGKWSQVQSHFFLKQTNATGESTVRKIKALEYWADGKSDNRVVKNLTAVKTYTWSELIDFSTLTDGLHTFHARFQDDGGMWSQVQSHFFLKRKSATGESTVRKIEALEYWADGNTENRVAKTLTPAETYTWNELLDFSTLADGLHTFHVRFRDDGGMWSQVQSHFFLKQKSAVGESIVRKIEALEYWADGDTENRVAKTLTPAEVYTWKDSLDFSTLSDGLHTFHARFRDDGGVWSNVHSYFFMKRGEKTIPMGENRIVGYRMWYAAEPDYFHNVDVEAEEPLASINDSVSVTYLPKGKWQIAYQVKDKRGVWSPVITDSITKTNNALFSFTADKREIFRDESITFTPSHLQFIDSIVWNFGDGFTEVSFNPTHKYSTDGEFNVTATVYHKGSEKGIDYVEVKYISINTTDLSEPEVVSLRLYPVPVENELSIECMSAKMKLVRIVNLNGTILKQVKVDNSEKITIKTDNMPTGTYLIVIETDKGRMTEKILKR